jgi:DTW domain-containing protein YfiP
LIPACLGNAHLFIEKVFHKKSFGPILENACNDPDGTWVLFPSPDSLDICDIVSANMKATNSPLKGEYPMRHLVIIDGTWTSARRILSRNSKLFESMRKVCIKPKQLGQYRIRGEPNSQCLSTLEAAAYCVATIEGDETVYDRMMMVLDGLVESHTERMQMANGRPTKNQQN